jgi:predicted metal-dependent RNase
VSITQPHLDLQAPPRLPEGALRVMALGGLGEIGRNMAVLEFDGKLLVIDCGVLFPEAEQPGRPRRRALPLRVHQRQPLDPRRAGRRRPHAGRHAGAHR